MFAVFIYLNFLLGWFLHCDLAFHFLTFQIKMTQKMPYKNKG